ncbi:E3 ubiquitin-protein ligase RNF183 [Anolis carolinensis]|uniref:E3 ubiquitin-protein ligase RNF183 n=1 Tax=Anolis carolinensis TaxID=28377 RepID=UPI002F2B41EF
MAAAPGSQEKAGGGGGGGGGEGGGEQAGRQDEEAESSGGGGGGEAEGPGSEERECRICYNPFDAEARAPKVLECLHTFCLHCLGQMYRHQAPGGGEGPVSVGEALFPALAAVSLSCPLCRHRTLLPGGRLQDLPLNTKLAPSLPSNPGRRLQLQLLPLLPVSVAVPAEEPIQQRPLAAQSGPRAAPLSPPPSGPGLGPRCPGQRRRAQSRRQEVRTVRCVCVVFTFFSIMVVSITGPLFLNYSGWVELFMVSLFLVVAVVLALFSIMPYLLHSHEYRTVTAAFLAGERGGGGSGLRGPALGPVAGPSHT